MLATDFNNFAPPHTMSYEHQKSLPEGVSVRILHEHADERGGFTEKYRQEWFAEAPSTAQWSVCESRKNVLRGFHVHGIHHDFLTVLTGEMHLGLQDMRPWSHSDGLAAELVLSSDEPVMVHIPPGVAHGFWFRQPCMLLLGVSHYWSIPDEMACRWDDPDVRVCWPGAEDPFLSERDREAGSFRQMQQDLLKLMGAKR